jgi:hypothetical protein
MNQKQKTIGKFMQLAINYLPCEQLYSMLGANGNIALKVILDNTVCSIHFQNFQNIPSIHITFIEKQKECFKIDLKDFCIVEAIEVKEKGKKYLQKFFPEREEIQPEKYNRVDIKTQRTYFLEKLSELLEYLYKNGSTSTWNFQYKEQTSLLLFFPFKHLLYILPDLTNKF